MYKNIYYISKIVTFLYKKFSIYVTIAELPPLDRYEDTEKVDNTVYIWYNVSIKYRRCFYDRTTAEIGAKSIHGNI